MKSFLVAFDLTLPGSQYFRLTQFLQSNLVWARPLPSIWIIQNVDSTSTQSIRDAIKTIVAENDRIFVIEITKANWATSNINKEVTEWMKNSL